MEYPTTPFERAVDAAIARENARYAATPEARAARERQAELNRDWQRRCDHPHGFREGVCPACGLDIVDLP